MPFRSCSLPRPALPLPFASKLVLRLAYACSAFAACLISIPFRCSALRRCSARRHAAPSPCTADPFSAAPLHIASALCFSPATPHFPWRCQCLSVISSQCLYTSIRREPRSASPQPCMSHLFRFCACRIYAIPFHLRSSVCHSYAPRIQPSHLLRRSRLLCSALFRNVASYCHAAAVHARSIHFPCITAQFNSVSTRAASLPMPFHCWYFPFCTPPLRTKGSPRQGVASPISSNLCRSGSGLSVSFAIRCRVFPSSGFAQFLQSQPRQSRSLLCDSHALPHKSIQSPATPLPLTAQLFPRASGLTTAPPLLGLFSQVYAVTPRTRPGFHT